jgi:hypothetical protein
MDIIGKVERGEYTVTTRSKIPDPPPTFEPPGTMTEEIKYFDEKRKQIAEAHCYRRPDGTIGASGMIDPKEVVCDGVLYYLPDRV